MNALLSHGLRERIRSLAAGLADEVTDIALSAFHEGRHRGASRAREELSAFCQAQLDEIEREAAKLENELAPHLQRNFPNPDSPEMIVAHIGASTLAFESVKQELERLAKRAAASSQTPLDREE